MIFTHPLDTVLGQKSKVKALRYLVNYRREISIREIAKEIGLVPANVSEILKELETADVLTSKRIGRSVVFALNENNHLTKYLIVPLFLKEKELKADFKKILLKNIKFDFESIILFGSVSRGMENAKSDIDLAVVIKDKNKINDAENLLLDINPIITEAFGNSISPVIYDRKDFIEKIKCNDNLARNIAKEGTVLSGKLISELL